MIHHPRRTTLVFNFMPHWGGRSLLWVVCLFATTNTASLHAAQQEKSSSVAAGKPNIIVILADDMGSGDPGCYNPASKTPTPNLNRLAAEGMMFTDAHTPSSVCTPTRYGVLTGKYCWRTRLKKGVLVGDSPYLIEDQQLTIPLFLRNNGYHTAGIGKWHLGLGDKQPTDFSKPLLPGPNTAGFDYYFGIPASLDMQPYVFFENDRVTEAATERIGNSEMRRNGGGGFWRAGPIAPGFKHENVLPKFTEKAVEFIQKQANDKPFFLYLPLNSPHTPWMPTPEFRGKSKADWYGDFVVQTDDTVGRVMQALQEKKLAENTLIFFTSDNGAHWLPSDIEKFDHRANAGWRGQKADIWEGGHRVPFIARWPGKIVAGSKSNQLLCLTDLLATIAAVIGQELPKDAGVDSYNQLPALQGNSAARDAIVHHSVDGTFGIRQGEWKLCTALGSHGFSNPKEPKAAEGGPQGQLYNLAQDPIESNNLWLQQPERVAKLTALLKKYQSEGRSRP